CDLVILNEDYSGYRAVLHERLMDVICSEPAAELLDKPGGLFVRRADQVPEEDRVLFQTVARVVLVDTAGTLAEQAARRAPAERMPPPLVPRHPSAPPGE